MSFVKRDGLLLAIPTLFPDTDYYQYYTHSNVALMHKAMTCTARQMREAIKEYERKQPDIAELAHTRKRVEQCPQ